MCELWENRVQFKGSTVGHALGPGDAHILHCVPRFTPESNFLLIYTLESSSSWEFSVPQAQRPLRGEAMVFFGY